MSIRGTTKKRGRPPTTGPGVSLNVRLHDDDLQLLDAWIAANGEMTRPEGLRRILKLVATRVAT